MMMIKVWTLLVALACSAAAFAPTARPAQNHVAALRMVGERPEIAGVARFFGVFAAAAVFAFNPLSEASATAPASRNSISSRPLSTSTVQLGEAIKVLDMSMPKYDEIKPYKASVENVKSLSMTPDKSGNVGIPASAKKKGMPISSVLPSTGKKGPKAKTSSDGYNF